jgi:single-stranded DNA-binding protein
MQITGIIKVIKPIQQVSATFSKREFVIETQEQYPQTIQLELHGDRVDIVESFTEGQEIECHINLRGRSWTNPQGEEKFFNTIVCWKIQLPNTNSAPQPQGQRSPSTAPTIPPVNEQSFQPSSSGNGEEHDDLPF